MMHATPETSELALRIRVLSRPLQPVPTDTTPVLNVLEGIRAILFDVYGTLVISGSGDVGTIQEQTGAGAFSIALKETGFEILQAEMLQNIGAGLLKDTIKDFHKKQHASGVEYPEVEIRDIWRSVLETCIQDKMIKGPLSSEMISRFAVEYECRTNPTYPMPGLETMLEQLGKNGFPLGIVSNAQFYTPLLFDALLHTAFQEAGFDPRLCSWSYAQMEAKPSTQLFQGPIEALKKHHAIQAHEIVYVGNDMRNDIWTASSCGLRTVLFAGDARSLRLRKDDENVSHVTPDAVITNLGQLIGILQGPDA